jgi:cyclase
MVDSAKAQRMVGALTLAATLGFTVLAAQPNQNRPTQSAQDVGAGTVEVLPVQGNVYLLAGAGGNITVQVGTEAVLLVDTGTVAMSDKVLAAVRQISTKPIRYIINTNFYADHTGGNEKLSMAGTQIGGMNIPIADQRAGAAIIAHEKALNRLSTPSGDHAAAPFKAWPTDTYFTDTKELFNGEAIQIFYAPAAATDGDSIVFFRRSDVVSTGDVFTPSAYPKIDGSAGGSIAGVLGVLNHIIDLTIPQGREEGGTLVIPGQGRICDEADVVEYRDMATIIRDRVQDMIQKGMTLEQVKAARLTLDYDGEYGATSGAWTTDMFIAAVYQSLSKARPK